MKNIIALLLLSAASVMAQITVRPDALVFTDEKPITFAYQNYKNSTPEWVTNVVENPPGTFTTNVVYTPWMSKKAFVENQMTNYVVWLVNTQWKPAYNASLEQANDFKAFIQELRAADDVKQSNAVWAARQALK